MCMLMRIHANGCACVCADNNNFRFYRLACSSRDVTSRVQGKTCARGFGQNTRQQIWIHPAAVPYTPLIVRVRTLKCTHVQVWWARHAAPKNQSISISTHMRAQHIMWLITVMMRYAGALVHMIYELAACGGHVHEPARTPARIGDSISPCAWCASWVCAPAHRNSGGDGGGDISAEAHAKCVRCLVTSASSPPPSPLSALYVEPLQRTSRRTACVRVSVSVPVVPATVPACSIILRRPKRK